MKTVMVILIGLFCYSSYAQLSDAQINRLKYRVDSSASVLHEKLIGKSVPLLNTTFTVDTFKVELLMKYKISLDTSKSEYVSAINDAEIEYDLLLDKYYKLLLSMHDDDTRKSLAEAQKKWIEYRDDEIKTIEKFYAEQKNANAKNKEVAKAKEHMELTKDRVIELFKHVLEN
jgi:uncharacterized protein YecT (DUF1311 family)